MALRKKKCLVLKSFAFHSFGERKLGVPGLKYSVKFLGEQSNSMRSDKKMESAGSEYRSQHHQFLQIVIRMFWNKC